MDQGKKYENLGVKIVEAYDEDCEFFVIEGRECVYYRTKDWVGFDYQTDEEYLSKINEKLDKELKIHCTAVVYITKEQTFEDAKVTLLSLFNSKLPPRDVVIVYQDNSRQLSTSNKLPEYSADLHWCQSNLKDIKFTIEYPTDNPRLHNMLNIAINKVMNSYIILEAGKELGPDVLSNINRSITHDLYPVTAAKHIDDRYHELFAFKKFSDYLGGFGQDSIQEKIVKLTEDAEDKEKCNQTFLKYEQI